ncbi:MAG: T9SS type A sorting domain-containing protein [Bacteroidetes bacterium]|nr:MAG: T9SS type A sorting domain-containing protein [Bacteroidota bacterium]
MKPRTITTLAQATLLACILTLVFCSANAQAQGTTGYVLTDYSYSIYPLNLSSQTTLSSFSTSNYTRYGSLNPNGTRLWFAYSGQFYVVNTVAKTTATPSYYVSQTMTPALSPDGQRAYVLRGTYPVKLYVYDAETYVKVDSFATGSNYANTIPVLSPDGNFLYFTDDNYYLNEIDLSTGSVTQRLYLSRNTVQLKITADGATIFALHNSYNSISVIDLAGWSVTAQWATLSYPMAMELDRAENKLYVVHSGSTSLRTFALPGGTTTDYSIGTTAYHIVKDQSDSVMYITVYSSSSNIKIYNTRTNTVTKTLSVSTYPMSVVMPLPLDSVRPSGLTNIVITAPTFNTLRLLVTAPGDDSLAGRASVYAVRYDTVPITESNFNSARRVSPLPKPSPQGAQDTITIQGLLGQKKYYVAIKVGDEVLNYSSLLTDSITTPPPPVVAVEPDSTSLSIADNDSVVFSFLVKNTGGSDLVYNVDISMFENVPATLSKTSPGKPASAVKNIGVLGYDSYYFASYLNADTAVNQQFYFYSVGQNWTYSTISQYDGVVVSETDYNLTDQESQALQHFYNSQKPILLGMDDMDEVTYATKQIVYSIFGVTNVADGDFYVGRANLSHPITHQLPYLYSMGGDNDHYDANGATWLLKSNDSNYYAFAYNGPKARSAIFGENLFSWYSSNVYLIRNAIEWTLGSGFPGGGGIDVTFAPDSGVVHSNAQQTIQGTIITEDAQPGTYRLTVGIQSNDPANDMVEFPVNITISDLTPPRVSLSVFQNEAFPRYLNMVCVARESLYHQQLSVIFGNDTSYPSLELIDTNNFVYNADYKLQGSGVVTTTLEADDSLNNHVTLTRQLSALLAAPFTVARLSTADDAARLTIYPQAMQEQTYLIADAVELAGQVGIVTPMGPVYRFGPQTVALEHPAQIAMRYNKQDGVDESHVGIYYRAAGESWRALPTSVDKQNMRAYADVERLGEFLLVYDPSVYSGEYQQTPQRYELQQNYPNPFNPSTVIRYSLPYASVVTLKVYTMLGQEVTTLVNSEEKKAGEYDAPFGAELRGGITLPSGVYYYRLSAESIEKDGTRETFTDVKRMLLVK